MQDTISKIYELEQHFTAARGSSPNTIFLGEKQYLDLLTYCGVLLPVEEKTTMLITMFIGIEVVKVCEDDYLRVGTAIK